MNALKRIHNKVEGNPYKQMIFSFGDEASSLSIDKINEIGCKIGSYYANEYQIIGAVHLDTDNLHIHYVLNTVNMLTGYKFGQSSHDLWRYKKYINAILLDYGLSPIDYYGRENEV